MANATTPRFWAFELEYEPEANTFATHLTTVSRTPDGDVFSTQDTTGVDISDLGSQVTSAISDHSDLLTAAGFTVTGTYPVA